jgi:hypothetical protein
MLYYMWLYGFLAPIVALDMLLPRAPLLLAWPWASSWRLLAPFVSVGRPCAATGRRSPGVRLGDQATRKRLILTLALEPVVVPV